MSYLSIREMNISMVFMEQLRDEQMKQLPHSDEDVYYFHIQRKSKSVREKWVHVRDFVGTKPEIARLYIQSFLDGEHRIKILLKYPKARR